MTRLPDRTDPAAQRARAKRTVLMLAVVALAIYVAFIVRVVWFR